MLRRAWVRLLCCERGWRTTASGRNRCSAGGISSVRRIANSVSRPARSVGAPIAGHVGLAEADEPVAADPANQCLGPVHDHRRQRRIGGADHGAVGIDHADRQPCRRAPEQPVGDGARHRADRSAGHSRDRRPAAGIDCRRGGIPPDRCSRLLDPFLSPRDSVRGTTGNASQPQRDALHPNADRAHQRGQRRHELQPQQSRRCPRAAGYRAWSRRTRAGCRGAARSARRAASSGSGARTR